VPVGHPVPIASWARQSPGIASGTALVCTRPVAPAVAPFGGKAVRGAAAVVPFAPPATAGVTRTSGLEMATKPPPPPPPAPYAFSGTVIEAKWSPPLPPFASITT
jgi:hypothetical protein